MFAVGWEQWSKELILYLVDDLVEFLQPLSSDCRQTDKIPASVRWVRCASDSSATKEFGKSQGHIPAIHADGSPELSLARWA
jgi:hypothetical protein